MHKFNRALLFWLLAAFAWVADAPAVIIPYEELLTEISVDCDGAPLIDVIAKIEREIKLPIVVDESVLRAAGFDVRQRVTLHLKNVEATKAIIEAVKQTKPTARLCIIAHPDYLRGGPKRILLTTVAGHQVDEMILLPKAFDP